MTKHYTIKQTTLLLLWCLIKHTDSTLTITTPTSEHEETE
jgi:hypothetical protein